MTPALITLLQSVHRKGTYGGMQHDTALRVLLGLAQSMPDDFKVILAALPAQEKVRFLSQKHGDFCGNVEKYFTCRRRQRLHSGYTCLGVSRRDGRRRRAAMGMKRGEEDDDTLKMIWRLTSMPFEVLSFFVTAANSFKITKCNCNLYTHSFSQETSCSLTAPGLRLRCTLAARLSLCIS